jgi:hypothetical protein
MTQTIEHAAWASAGDAVNRDRGAAWASAGDAVIQDKAK